MTSPAAWTRYVFRCQACGHKDEVLLSGDRFDGLIGSCTNLACGADITLEWDDGVRFGRDPAVSAPECYRVGDGLRVTGARVDVSIFPATEPGKLSLRLSATPAATGTPNGCSLHDYEAKTTFRFDEIRVEFGELKCLSRGDGFLVPEFGQGFTFVLEPGQEPLVKDALDRMRCVANATVALDAAVTRARADEDGGMSHAALSSMAAAVVLDGAGQDRAIAAARAAYHGLAQPLQDQLSSERVWTALCAVANSERRSVTDREV